MKKSLLVFVVFMIANQVMAGNDILEKRIAKEKAYAMALNEAAKQPANRANKTNTIYYLDGSRHDYFDQNTSAWQLTDSTQYFYAAGVNDTLELGYGYDNTLNSWYASSRVIMAYNGSQLILKKTQYYDTGSSSWTNSNQETFTFNSSSQLTEHDEVSWMNNAWLITNKHSYTYDPNGKVSTLTSLAYNYFDNVLENDFKEIYTYDNQTNLLTTLGQIGNGSNWGNYSKYDYTYNGNNQVTSEIFQDWLSSTSIWRNQNKYTYTYDGNGNLSSRLGQGYSSSTSTWVDRARIDYTYDGNNNQLTKESFDIYSGGNVVPSSKQTNQYDSHNNTTQELYENWSTTTSSYYPGTKNKYTFDGNDNLTYKSEEYYDQTASAFIYRNRTYYYYKTYTAVGIEETATVSDMCMYPNPASGGQAIVSFSLKTDATVAINMYDINGRLVCNQTNQFGAGDNKASIETGKLANGIYQVQWVNLKDNSTATLKLLVQ